MTIHSFHAQEAVKYLQYMVASMPDVESFREYLAKGQHFLKRAQEDVAEDEGSNIAEADGKDEENGAIERRAAKANRLDHIDKMGESPSLCSK